MKCPNCAGEMEIDSVRRIQVCPYCETEMPVSGTVVQTPINAPATIISSLFVIRSIKFNDAGKETWEVLCSSLNSGKNSEQLKEDVIQLAKGKEECATLTWNQELGGRAVQIIVHTMRRDEIYFFYKDSGVFSKLKEGVLLTDKRIYFMKKKRFDFIEYANIRKIQKSTLGGHWYFDNDYMIDTIGCTNMELGRILAYICMRAYETRRGEHKIVVDTL